MTIEHEQWKEILSAIDADKNLSKDNVIEKVKEKLSQYSDEYKEWDKASFNVNHLFHAVNESDNPFLREDDKCTLLHLAARNNLENITEALLGVEGIDVNAADGLPVWTPLHYAAQFNSEKVIDILLKAEKININAESCRKCTPLHIAAYYDSGKAIDTLLKAKDINVNAIDKDNKTPLLVAASNSRNEGALNILVERADVKAVDRDGNTPLHLVAL
ncbi:MAG: ankyrin repeat domain-containing protein, partial [Wolbachia sp.]